LADQSLQPGDRIGPHELNRRLDAHPMIHCNIESSNILADEMLASDPISSPVAGATG